MVGYSRLWSRSQGAEDLLLALEKSHLLEFKGHSDIMFFKRLPFVSWNKLRTQSAKKDQDFCPYASLHD